MLYGMFRGKAGQHTWQECARLWCQTVVPDCGARRQQRTCHLVGRIWIGVAALSPRLLLALCQACGKVPAESAGSVRALFTRAAPAPRSCARVCCSSA
eukprot:331161-Chlamydomonas_euryale.AAC.5